MVSLFRYILILNYNRKMSKFSKGKPNNWRTLSSRNLSLAKWKNQKMKMKNYLSFWNAVYYCLLHIIRNSSILIG